MKVCIVGATGLVGKTIIKLLEERKFPVDQLIPTASERSTGKTIFFRNNEIKVAGISEGLAAKPDLVLFSAGGKVSKEFAPAFAQYGKVIDNSSAWRMYPEIKLIVPEINAKELKISDKIIANPNCSTIQLVMILAPLHKKFIINRVVISTYQSVSGSGVPAINQMESERNSIKPKMFYPHPIDLNCLPHCGDFTDNGYTTEEVKLVNETRKILNDQVINITATAARIPVLGGHSESVNVEFSKNFELKDIINILNNSPGIEVTDDPKNNIYPMPLSSANRDEVFVGRIRRDRSRENCLNLWIVSDNIRKGAATNAVQIAEYMLGQGLI